MSAGRNVRAGKGPRTRIVTLTLASGLLCALPGAPVPTAAAGLGAPVVGTAPMVRPAPIQRAPTVVTTRPKLPAPKPVVPADPTPIIQSPPFRANTPVGGQPGSGAPLGVLPGGLATPLVGPAPAPNTCWFYTTPAKTVGYWSKCP